MVADIVTELGPGSAPFTTARDCWLNSLNGAGDNLAATAFAQWRLLYPDDSGGLVPAELFLRHTYLATVSRYAVAVALHDWSRPKQPLCAVTPVLTYANSFADAGIDGYVPTNDLFCWPDSTPNPACSMAASRILKAVSNLRIHDHEGDLLKQLHNSLTAPSTRRGLGESYTPDWLAGRLIRGLNICASDGMPSILDPACGSGTFLALAIHALRRELPGEPQTLAAILKSVRGIDINPVALEMARANYLFALGPLLAHRRESIRIPVKMGDALARNSSGELTDIVLGNPPWAPLRSYAAEKQERLKRMAAESYGLTSGRSELATHMETATLFLAHCADSRLAPNGVISFVLPFTILASDHHHAIRSGAIRLPASPGWRLQPVHVLDCEKVSPLFETPALVLTCRKVPSDGNLHCDEVSVTRLSGRLNDRDSSIEAAADRITESESMLKFRMKGSRSWWTDRDGISDSTHNPSPYRSRFTQGATLVPRTFWFVDRIEQIGRENGHRSMERIRTSEPGKAGPVAQYRHLRFEGEAPACFLYRTMLGDDVLPFASRGSRTVLLPLEWSPGGMRMITASDAVALNIPALGAWLGYCEDAWSSARGEKAARMSIYARLNHVHGLTRQRPAAAYRVLYPNFQRAAVACVASNAEHTANPGRFIVDTSLYYCETDSRAEAHYLCAVLNSRVIDETLMPLRRPGQAAHPNVHKKMFDLAPIPLHNGADPVHSRLAMLSERCSEVIAAALSGNNDDLRGSIGAARRAARSLIETELAEIDDCVRLLLHL